MEKIRYSEYRGNFLDLLNEYEINLKRDFSRQEICGIRNMLESFMTEQYCNGKALLEVQLKKLLVVLQGADEASSLYFVLRNYA